MNYQPILTIVLTLGFLVSGSCSNVEGVDNPDSSVLIRAKSYWQWYHDKSEFIYDDNGEWGNAYYGFRDVLRNSYWKADAYGRLSETSHEEAAIFAARATAAVNFLIQAQTEGGAGIFGIPDEPNHPEFGSTIQQIRTDYPQGINNGWIVELPGDKLTELFYDHGYGLVALCREYQRTGNSSLLAPINEAANWILNNYIASENENYHSAVSKGLSYAYEVTQNNAYLDKAVDIHETLIIPHQQPDGKWDDDHNRRLVYHGFISSGLIALKKVLPAGHYFHTTLDNSLIDAITVLEAECNAKKASEYPGGVVGWPGTCIMAWVELADIRPLTTSETAAMEIAVDYIIASQTWVEDNFSDPEALGMMRVSAPIGLYIAKFGYGK